MRTEISGISSRHPGELVYPRRASQQEKLRFFISYATLAPSSHNTQPWKFSIRDASTVDVYVDRSRWLRVADKEMREMHISAGCALENLIIAAEHFGYEAKISYMPETGEPDLVSRVNFKQGERPSSFRPPELYGAITRRYTNHKAYEARIIPDDCLARIRDCAVEEGVEVFLTSDAGIKRTAEELVVKADALQFSDLAFRQELGYWIGQGAFGMPWLMAKAAQLAVTYIDVGKSTARKDSELLMSAPVLGLICSDENGRESQLKVGQVFERIYLTATSLGLSLQPMSQIVQVPEIKAELTKLVPETGMYPQQPFRLGYAEVEKRHTPRRPLEEVLV